MPPLRSLRGTKQSLHRQSFKYNIWVSGVRLIGHPEILVWGLARVEIASFLAMTVLILRIHHCYRHTIMLLRPDSLKNSC